LGKYPFGPPRLWSGGWAGRIMVVSVSVNADPTWCLESVT
jgi:hypothetical protein